MDNRGVGIYKIDQLWTDDSLTFFEKSVGQGGAGNVLRIDTNQVTIGDAAQDIDLKVWLGATQYALFDAGAHTVTLAGLDVTITGDLTIDTEDIALGDNDSLEFGDAADVAITWDTDSLNILPVADDTGRIEIGNGTKDMDLIWFGGAAGDYVEFDVGNKALDLVNIVQTITNTTAAAGAYTGLYTTITTGQTHTGNVAGIRSIVQTDNTGDSIANIFALMSRAFLQHASDVVTGTMTALLAQIDMGAVSNSNAANAWGICVDHIETGTRAKIPVAFIRFTDSDYDGAAPTNYLFDLGGTGNQFPSGTGKIYYRNTLWIRVNGTDQYLALSSAEGTYTTAYPIVSTNATPIALNGTLTKGIDFASATPAHGDADDAFIAVGTWNDTLNISSQVYHFVPIQVNLTSGTSVAADIAAARFRVNTHASTANTLTNVNVLEMRSKLQVAIGSHANLQVSTEVSENIECTGDLLVGYFSLQGDGVITCSNHVNVLEATCVMSSGASGIDNVAHFTMNSTGVTATNALKVEAIAGTLTNLINVVNTSGTVTNGINVSVASNGIVCTSTTLHATTGRVGKFVGTTATPNMDDGYGVFEVDTTISGIGTGHYAAFSAWTNITGTAASGAQCCVMNNGIYENGTITGAELVFGGKLQAILTNSDFGKLTCWSLNTGTSTITALYRVGAPGGEIGYQAQAAETATKLGDIPFMVDNAGVIYYVRLYDGRT